MTHIQLGKYQAVFAFFQKLISYLVKFIGVWEFCMEEEALQEVPPEADICQSCRLGAALFMAYLQLRNAKLRREYTTCLELTPCDLVALLLDPNEQENPESDSGSNLDLMRNCFHQCLTLFRNGVSEHVVEIVLGYSLNPQEAAGYIS
jgi:hypothetical protein